MDVAKRMKELRKAKGISAETIAEYLGTNPTTIYRYEKGDIEKMPISILEPIAKILGCSPAYLMGWTDNPDENIKSLNTFDVEAFYKAMYLSPYEKGGTKNICGEDLKKAWELYDQYKKSIPQVQNAVDALLKPSQPDS